MRFALLKVAQLLALLPLAPVLMAQGALVRKRTPRLPPAGGPEHGEHALDGGHAERGAAVRLTVLGESTAVGVGAERHEEALPGFLAAALAGRIGRPVRWHVKGASGFTVRELRRESVGELPPSDAVVLVIGINDLLHMRSLRGWERDVAGLVEDVRRAAGPVPVLVTGMPYVGKFPSLPQPLRAVMGLRALAMDHATRRSAARLPDVRHLRAVAPDLHDPRFYCADRFHPSVEGYRLWAAQLAVPLAGLVTEPASGR